MHFKHWDPKLGVQSKANTIPAKIRHYINVTSAEQALQVTFCRGTSCISSTYEVPFWKPSFLPHQLGGWALKQFWPWGYSEKASWADSTHFLSITLWWVSFYSSFLPLRTPFEIIGLMACYTLCCILMSDTTIIKPFFMTKKYFFRFSWPSAQKDTNGTSLLIPIRDQVPVPWVFHPLIESECRLFVPARSE